ncbi:MAG: DUF2310 family Zn-ribbon-containing protein [Flavobacteriales bacterium]|nr:DUF2310 family Zn-ribbon-containing protein [Flavobacteriales bacterium]
MHIYKIEVLSPSSFNNEVYENLENLTSIWYNLGEITNVDFNFYSFGNHNYFMVSCLEKDSLNFSNNYSEAIRLNLLTKKVNLKVKYIGEDNSVSVVVSSSLKEKLILFPGKYSPLRSMKDFSIVPLYRILNEYKELDNYDDIKYWRNMHDSLYQLWRDGTYENFSKSQLSNIKSKFSLNGLDICRRIEGFSQIETYYYLFNTSAKSRKYCPICGKESSLEVPLFNLFGFRCDICKIISE